MAFKSYHTMNGQIIGESGPEGAVDYQLDGLGSVIGTWRSTGTIQNQYRYSGYGQLVHKSGAGTDPYFLWVGGWGYRTRGMVYVRRRVFYEDAAVWTSVDPLWPWESAYEYAGVSPLKNFDYTGYCTLFLPTAGFELAFLSCKCSTDVTQNLIAFPSVTDKAKRRCLKAACSDYCLEVSKWTRVPNSECAGQYGLGISKCKFLNGTFPPCLSNHSYWQTCGELFTVPGGTYFIPGAFANLSNYPAPAPQNNWSWVGWQHDAGHELCCIECKMRVCCSVLGALDPCKNLKKAWSRCLGGR